MSRKKKFFTPTRALRTLAGASLAVVVASYAAKVIVTKKIERDFRAERPQDGRGSGHTLPER